MDCHTIAERLAAMEVLKARESLRMIEIVSFPHITKKHCSKKKDIINKYSRAANPPELFNNMKEHKTTDLMGLLFNVKGISGR